MLKVQFAAMQRMTGWTARVAAIHGLCSEWQLRGKHTGNPLFFWHDLRCDYCAKLAIWLARYEDFDDEQD
jgi:hypothetical protein